MTTGKEITRELAPTALTNNPNRVKHVQAFVSQVHSLPQPDNPDCRTIIARDSIHRKHRKTTDDVSTSAAMDLPVI